MRVLTSAEITAVGDEAMANVRLTLGGETMGRALLLPNFSPKLWAAIEEFIEDARTSGYREGYEAAQEAAGLTPALPEALAPNPIAAEHATIEPEEAPEAGHVKGQ